MLSSEDIPKQLRGPRSFVETRADGVHVAHNLPYQVEADKYVPHKHDLDVFVPAETNTDFRTPRPVVIFVHGGGWKKGDRKYFLGLYSNVGVSFASRGFVTVLPSYRLSKVPFYLTALLSLLHAAIISAIIGLLAWSLTVALAAYLPVYIVLNLIHWYIRPRTPVKHPEHAQDVASAVKWVMTNIEHFGGDPSSIFLSGHSAGGHLVSLVALDPKYLDDIGVGHLRASIKGVIGISGVYVLNPMLQSWVARPLYLLPAFGSDTSVWPDAFPARWVSAQAPPFQLFNATKDWGLEEHTALFAAELSKFGIPNEQHVIPNTNHLSIIRSVGKKHDEITDRAVLFMRSLYNK